MRTSTITTDDDRVLFQKGRDRTWYEQETGEPVCSSCLQRTCDEPAWCAAEARGEI